MKKIIHFTILMCVLLISAPIVSATTSTKELLIVKQNETVYYFNIYNYGDVNMYVISNVLVDPKTSDLVILETPKEAWPIINQVGDGIFDTRINKLESQLLAGKERIKDLEEVQGAYGGIIIISIIIVTGLLLLCSILGKYWFEDHEKLKALSKEVK